MVCHREKLLNFTLREWISPSTGKVIHRFDASYFWLASPLFLACFWLISPDLSQKEARMKPGTRQEVLAFIMKIGEMI
jgi:hypothetical protein